MQPWPRRCRPNYQPSIASLPVQPAIDPFEQERRKREERAPFASNIVVSITGEKHEPARELQLASKSTPDISDRRETKKEEDAKNIGSGRYRPAREGELYRVYEGTFVETTLTNRLDGSFTGPVECLVSKDVRSLGAEALVIPKGSKFFGEAKRVEAAGQSRLAVTFKRLLLPNGYSVDLDNAPGLSAAGEMGLRTRPTTITRVLLFSPARWGSLVASPFMAAGWARRNMEAVPPMRPAAPQRQFSVGSLTPFRR